MIKYESVIHEFDPYFNYRVTQVCFLTETCSFFILYEILIMLKVWGYGHTIFALFDNLACQPLQITHTAALEDDFFVFLFSIFQRREFMNFGTGLMIGPGNFYFVGSNFSEPSLHALDFYFFYPKL